MLTGLQKEARVLVLTLPEGERAADPAHLMREHGPRYPEGGRARVETDVVRAVELAAEEIRGVGGVVLVVGSLQTAAPALRWLRAQ
jgi:folylpolyglutamate synthase/dihydropteroate synthase